MDPSTTSPTTLALLRKAADAGSLRAQKALDRHAAKMALNSGWSPADAVEAAAECEAAVAAAAAASGADESATAAASSGGAPTGPAAADATSATAEPDAPQQIPEPTTAAEPGAHTGPATADAAAATGSPAGAADAAA